MIEVPSQAIGNRFRCLKDALLLHAKVCVVCI
jgi:hypothetical protein